MSYSVDDKGLLQGNKVEHKLVDKHSGKFATNFPDMLVMHYTAGSSLDGAVSHLLNPNVKASAHLVIGRDARIVQLVEFTNRAWHAGKSKYLDRSGINRYSIGIELDNAGPLKASGNKFISDFGKHYSANDVIEATHRNETTSRFWHTYTEEQLECVSDVCETLIEHYAIETLVGHEEIAPLRKTDPGPAFPLDKFRSRLLENRSEIQIEPEGVAFNQFEKGVVTASALNFRDSPSKTGKLLSEPLSGGTPLTIMREKNGWYQVKYELTGWVKKDFVMK
jgi:N-acetylmuramoyl-L-alanine amidase